MGDAPSRPVWGGGIPRFVQMGTPILSRIGHDLGQNRWQDWWAYLGQNQWDQGVCPPAPFTPPPPLLLERSRDRTSHKNSDLWTDRRLWKHILPVVLRTLVPIINADSSNSIFYMSIRITRHLSIIRIFITVIIQHSQMFHWFMIVKPWIHKGGKIVICCCCYCYCWYRCEVFNRHTINLTLSKQQLTWNWILSFK